jgi:hypothetical protein
MTQHFFGLLAGVSASSCVAFTGYNIAVELNCAEAAALQRRVCTDEWIYTIATGVVNTLVDLYILVLPIAMVMRLQLTPQRKRSALWRYSRSALCKLNEVTSVLKHITLSAL